MKNWKEYWNTVPRGFGDQDFLCQVGKTVGGVPIKTEQIKSLLNDICTKLNLKDSDNVLDVCCGNGFVTNKIAPEVNLIVGIDYSEILVEIANKYQSSKNSSYKCMSALHLTLDQKFDKVYMYEGLQHFAVCDLEANLKSLQPHLNEDHLILFASIPDKGKIWEFYNTEERRAEYHRRVEEGTEAIGTWWEKNQLQEIAEQNGYQCQFSNQSSDLHTAHYRFDVVLSG